MERQNARGGTNGWRRTSFPLSVVEGLLQFLIDESGNLNVETCEELAKERRGLERELEVLES